METDGSRRTRRGRPYNPYSPPRAAPTYFSGKNLAATAVAIGLMLLMMHYNCRNCHSKQELSKLANSVDDIAKHLYTIKNNYEVLETKLSMYSQELPKIEEQLAALEALGRSVEAAGIGWDPRTLPFVDIHLNNLNKVLKDFQIKNASMTSIMIKPVKQWKMRRSSKTK